MSLNAAVRQYWEKQPCGTSGWIVGRWPIRSREWFASVEQHRYREEPKVIVCRRSRRRTQSLEVEQVRRDVDEREQCLRHERADDANADCEDG